MYKVKTASFTGIKGNMVEAEINISKGIPHVYIIGMVDARIREAAQRIKSAVRLSGFDFPNARITVNLSPADINKRGTHFDLAIAIGIIWCREGRAIEEIKDFAMFGELSLDGSIIGVNGLVPMLLSCVESGIKKILVPEANRKEAELIKGVTIYTVKSLTDAYETVAKIKHSEAVEFSAHSIYNEQFKSKVGDFGEVYGQEVCKRGLAVAAAGGHGVIMLGSPGIGKTMLARRIIGIMEPMSYEEILEVSRIYSAAGLLKDNKTMVSGRPFRNPHPNTSTAAMLGGGGIPRPGELSLAHGGVLFLDEVTDFSSKTLELMRQPIEDGSITIIRKDYSVNFPARPLIVMATNPCRCGWFGDEQHRCNCSAAQINRFWTRLAGPLLDRMDIHLRLNKPEYCEVAEKKPVMKSQDMKNLVVRARNMQRKRFRKDVLLNSEMDDAQIRKYCCLDKESEKFIKENYNKLNMTVRAYTKVLKLARTIADMEECEDIALKHILEACQYNRVDQWKEDCIGI